MKNLLEKGKRKKLNVFLQKLILSSLKILRFKKINNVESYNRFIGWNKIFHSMTAHIFFQFYVRWMNLREILAGSVFVLQRGCFHGRYFRFSLYWRKTGGTGSLFLFCLSVLSLTQSKPGVCIYEFSKMISNFLYLFISLRYWIILI